MGSERASSALTENGRTSPPPLPRPGGPARVGLKERAFAAVMGVGLLSVLVVAAGLTPSAEGHGTHTRLGIPPCSWASLSGYPCPTCGMTTSFAHAADGNVLRAIRVQPAGALLCVLTAAGFWGAMHVAATGSRLGRLVGNAMSNRVMWIALAVLLGGWGYKLATWPGVGSM